MSRPVLPILLILLLLALPAGCGKKGPVQPLKQPLPTAPEALTVQQKGDRFLVSWLPPVRNQDGSELKDLKQFRVYKMRYDLADDCPECRDTSVLVAEIDLDYLRDVRRIGDRFFLWNSEMEVGFGYQFRVVPITRKGREGNSALLRLPFVTPPPPPVRLTAENHDRMVRLRWQPPVEVPAEAERVGFNVYRREGLEAFSLLPVNREILAEPAFDDYSVENGHTYEYAVRTVVRILETKVESQLSNPATAAPQPGL